MNVQKIIRSESDSKPNTRLLGILLVVAALLGGTGYWFMFFNPFEQLDFQAALTPTPLPLGHVLATSLPPTPTETATPTPVIIYEQISVTRQVTVTQEVISYVYIDRVVQSEVTAEPPLPTETPQPTPTIGVPGAVVVCVYVEGVTAIYLNGGGFVGNSCYTQPLDLITDISLKITK